MLHLLEQLAARADGGRPIRVMVIGAGKFGSMFLSQARRIRGLHVVAVVDLSPDRARAALRETGWATDQFAATSVEEAARTGSTCVTSEVDDAFEHGQLEVVVESTGAPLVAAAHALKAFARGCHVVMVTAEADALVGPILARKAASADVVYTMAYGDQPALICELVGWAQACGLDVICAGKGTRYRPEYRFSTPDTVWEHYGIDAVAATEGNLNPQMFNSFLDGTKSAIEMACVANATGLRPQSEGLAFVPCGADRLAQMLRPERCGGSLTRVPTVEVVSSLERDGSAVPNDLRWGVYVTFEASNNFVRRCFAEYGLASDESGRFAALYRPYHLVGLEVSVSVLSAALRHEPTGVAREYRADAVATAKTDLAAGDELDGEGGTTVFGTLLDSESAVELQALPIGLASSVRVKRPVAREALLCIDDVELQLENVIIALRREQESLLGPAALQPVLE